jgi:hypothetical protein
MHVIERQSIHILSCFVSKLYVNANSHHENPKGSLLCSMGIVLFYNKLQKIVTMSKIVNVCNSSHFFLSKGTQ